MEDKLEQVGASSVENVGEGNLSKSFTSRRELWAHMLKGGGVKFQTDYSKHTLTWPVLLTLDMQSNLLWNYGIRVPILAVNKASNLIKGSLRSGSGKSDIGGK